MRFISVTKKISFLLLFVLLTGFLYAGRESFVLLPLAIQFSQEETMEEIEKQLLTTLLVNEITGTDGKIVVRNLTSLLTDDRTIESAVSTELVTTGLAGWLFVRFEKQTDIIHLVAEYRILEGNKTAFSLENSDYLTSVFRNPERLFSELKESVRRVTQERGNEQYSAPLVIHGPAESVLFGFSDKETCLNTEGTAVLNLTAPALYSYTLNSPRHYPDSGTFFLDVSGKELTIDPEEISPLFLDVYLADFNVPGVEFGIKFGKLRRGFAKLGGYSYLLTLIPMLEDSEEEYGFALSEPLSVFNLQSGLLIGPWTDPFHFYVSGGVFCRLVHSSRFAGFDPLGPWGFLAAMGFEVRVGKKLRLYTEYNPQLYITRHLEYFEPLFPSGAIPLPSSTDIAGLLSLLNARLGIRIQL